MADSPESTPESAIGPPQPETEAEQLPPAEIPPPQLRLHHFFALTAVMAVLLAIAGPQRDFSQTPGQPTASHPTLWHVYGVLYWIPASVAITALAYGYTAYRRGGLFFNQPGHWLLFEISLATLLCVPAYLLIRWFDPTKATSLGSTSQMLSMIVGIYYLLVLGVGRLAINSYLGATKCRQRRWKSVFFGKAATSIFFGLGDIVVVLLLINAVRIDRREHLLRNAGHRCGVYVQLVQSSLHILTILISVLSMFLLSH